MWDGQEWFFRDGQIDAARHLVINHHYSKRFAGIHFVGTAHLAGGLFGDFGEAIAACCFGVPPSRWSQPLLELQRLVLHPDYRGFPLSSLISKTAAYIKKAKTADLLVSFADDTQGHHGGVYQASSWKYHGKRDSRVDGFMINGEFVPMRSANSRYGTASQSKLEEVLQTTVTPHYDTGKHLYWRALSRSGKYRAMKLGLKDCAYPTKEEA